MLLTVPPPKFYVQIYPVQIQFDLLSAIWLNTFFLNMQQSVLSTATVQDQQAASQLFYIDVRIEITMPQVSLGSFDWKNNWSLSYIYFCHLRQIVFEGNEEKTFSKDRPRTFQIEVSKISVTNTRTNGTVSSRANLAKVVNTCQTRSLFLSDKFPTRSTDFPVITDKFIDHVQSKMLFYNFMFWLTV